MEPKKIIIKSLSKILGLTSEEVELEIPREIFGDYSSNIVLKIFSKRKVRNEDQEINSILKKKVGKNILNLDIQLSDFKSSRDLAVFLIKKLRQDKDLGRFVEKIEIAGLGFINFWLKKDILIDNLICVIRIKDHYGRADELKGKRFLLEHTSPNTIKTLHVGHVRNNTLGMAVHNLLEFCGADVLMDAINNDRGIHVMKAVWAYMKYGGGKTPQDTREKPDHFVDRFYVLGVKEEEKNKVKEEMQELLRLWEAGDKKVRKVWKKLRDWTLEGFNETYKRLGSHHDHQWFESDFFKEGKKMVEEGLKKGVFRRLADGAVLSNLERYGLPDTIVLRGDGTSMYHTQDLYLTKLKREKFPSDFYIWDIGPEQELYLRQLFAMCEQLGIGRISDYMHLSYGFVYLKGKGKMSSRAGNVISADWLIDNVVRKAGEIIRSSETTRGLTEEEIKKVSEVVGIAAIKYGFLKAGRTTDLQFDIDESVSLEGNSGPYLQYTYARTQSVLAKSQILNSKFPKTWEFDIENLNLKKEELLLLRSFIHFSEIILMSAKNYSPNILCNYLYDLASLMCSIRSTVF